MTTVLVVVVFVAAYVLLVVLTAVASALLALLGAGALLAVSDLVISDAVADVEWPTLCFHGALRDGGGSGRGRGGGAAGDARHRGRGRSLLPRVERLAWRLRGALWDLMGYVALQDSVLA